MKDIDKLTPGIIRQCTVATDGQKWVIVDSTHWRWMHSELANECSSLSDDPSEVIGLLPPTELQSVEWCERYALPNPCIHNAQEYQPFWDCEAGGRWISRHLDSGDLYDMDGSFKVSVKPDTPQPSQPALAAAGSLASAAVRFFKKYW